MVRVLADRAVDGVVGSAVPRTTLAGLDSACKLFYSTDLDHNELPPLIQRSLDLLRYIDNLRHRDALIPSSDESIEDLHKVEGVALLTVGLHVFDLRPVSDRAFAA